MTGALLVLAWLSCAGLILWGLLGRDRIYEYPFLAAAVIAGWVLPQAIGLLGDPELPGDGLARALFMASLCTAMIHIGSRAKTRPWSWLTWKCDDKRLLYGAAIFSGVGAMFTFLIMQLPEELLIGQWTGRPVLYLFFATLQIYGFAIAMLIFARTRSRYALLIAAWNMLFFWQPIAIAARRGFAFELVLVVVMAFWFGRKWAIPRFLMLGLVIVGGLAVFSIGDYRWVAYQGQPYGGSTGRVPSWQELAAIDYVGNFVKVMDQGGYELRNAVYNMAAAAEMADFNFGASYWNELIFRYVPAQFFGEEAKAALMFELPDLAWEFYGHIAHPGSTVTGFSDAFQAFWYFGALVFFLVARVMSILYRAACEGHFVAQTVYVLMIADALQAITHQSSWFVSPWLHFGAFMLPVLLISRRSVPERERDGRSITGSPVGMQGR